MLVFLLAKSSIVLCLIGAWRDVSYALTGRRQIVWRVLMLRLSCLRQMENLKYSEGNYRVFLLYPDGRYQDMTGKQIDSLEAGVQVLELAGYQVINAEQYDLRGCEVETYSDGERGIAKERKAVAYGIKYRIEKADGSVFTAYDSNLEIIRRPERRTKSCNRSRKKPKREMER